MTLHLADASANPRTPLAERFWAKVPVRSPWPNDCWEWTAQKLPKGYGVFSIRRSVSMLAHRVAWELTSDPIPDEMEIDHACHNPACVRPEHLSLVTAEYNSRQGGHTSRAKTHCRNGHEYAVVGVLRGHNGRSRRCRACTRINWKKNNP